MKKNCSDLVVHLKDQYDLLKILYEAYDKGKDQVTVNIASVIRVLCHDKNRSKSLLGMMNLKSSDFYDTATDYDPQNLVYHSGLTQIMCDKTGFCHCPAFERRAPGDIKWTDFDSWWNKIIFADEIKNTHTREELVLSVCDKDGGAHIDLNISKKYYELSRTNFSRFYVNGDPQKPMPNDIYKAAIRQIGFEIIRTLDRLIKHSNSRAGSLRSRQ